MSSSLELVCKVEEYVNESVTRNSNDLETCADLLFALKEHKRLTEDIEYFIYQPEFQDSIEFSCQLARHFIDTYSEEDEEVYKKYKLSSYETLREFLQYLDKNYNTIKESVGYFRFVALY